MLRRAPSQNSPGPMSQPSKLALGALALLAALIAYLVFPSDAGYPSGELGASGGAGEAIETSPIDLPTRGQEEPESEAPGDEGAAAPERLRSSTDEARLRFRLLQGGQPLSGVVATLRLRRGVTGAPRELRLTSDRHGVVACFDELRGSVRLTLAGPGIPHGWSQRLGALRGAGPRDLGDIHVPRTGSVTGRVVDQEKRPLPGILVFVSRSSEFGSSFRTDIVDLEDPLSDLRVRTDAQGRFEIDGLGPGDRKLRFESPEHGNREESFELEEGARFEMGDVELRVGQVIRGRVITVNGAPISGARVAASRGGHGSFDLRGAAHTRADGSFELRGAPRLVGELRADCEGYVPAVLKPFDAKSFPLLRLQRTTPLLGRVLGLGGRAATVEIEAAEGEEIEHCSPLYQRYETDAEGRFQILGLEPGRYLVSAHCLGLGRGSTELHFAPDHPEVEITLEPFARVEVVVRDERGEPVADARVVRDPLIAENPRRYAKMSPTLAREILYNDEAERLERIRTDANGRAWLTYPAGEALALAAGGDRHVPDARVFRAEEVPARVELRVTRAASLVGRLTGPCADYRIATLVMLEPQARGAAGPARKREARTDARGRFRIDGVAAGDYIVRIGYRNRFDRLAANGSAFSRPLLGDGTGVCVEKQIRLEPGSEHRLLLEHPPLGKLRGRVLRGNEPAAGAIVFAVPVGQKLPCPDFPSLAPNFDAEDAHKFVTWATTSGDGSYTFFASEPGSYDLRVRLPKSPVSSSPVTVQVAAGGAERVQDFQLPGGVVRARYDPDRWEARRLVGAKAYLFRSDVARENPVFWSEWSAGLIYSTLAATPDAEGRIKFGGIGEGTWVLRLLSGWEILDEREFVMGHNECVELGALQPHPTRSLVIPVESSHLRKNSEGTETSWGWAQQFGVFVYRLTSRQPKGYFVAAVHVVDGKIKTKLAPGRYACELRSWTSVGLSFSFQGEAVGQPVRIVVRKDGATEPKALRF
ncbi:MAG: hypothetical protein CSA62_00990 [Planctomycetota bacterium]|nr:MAG: hypothetical protein CSA62_00990 [Planctomycetota bacterium]